MADGVEFLSETDTEVAAQLIARAYETTGDLTAAMTEVARSLHGTFTLLAVHEDAPDVVVGARHDSPLVVGHRRGRELPGLRRRGVHLAHEARPSSSARTRW